MSAELTSRYRQQKDHAFKTQSSSPLTNAQKAMFKGLSYYDFNPDLDMTISVNEFVEKTDIQFQTTTGETRWYRRFGDFTFTVDNVNARLTIYQAPHGYFLPVVDAGAGQETYPAGRYMEPKKLEGNEFKIDFNQLYNPFCAYNDKWSCPVTPQENRVSVSILAGEKLPADDWINQ